MRSRLIMVMVGSLLLIGGCWRVPSSANRDEFQAERRAAAQEAKQDIERGHLEIRTYGLPARWRNEYAGLLGNRLEVALVPVAGCVVTGQLLAEVDAYNCIMEREIERRYGKGVLDRLSDEAQAPWNEMRSETPVGPATTRAALTPAIQLRVGDDYDEAQAAIRARGYVITDSQPGFELARRRGRLPADFSVKIPGDRELTVGGWAQRDGAGRMVITSLTLLESVSRGGDAWVFRPLTLIDLESWVFQEGTWASQACPIE